MDFLEVIETIKTEEAGVRQLFGGEGNGVRQTRKSPEWLAKVSEAATFVAEIFQGSRPSSHFREAMTTSDFPLLFGDIIDRMLLAGYAETPTTYRDYAKVNTVKDFRTVNRFAIDGSEATLAVVPQQSEYPESSLSDSRYQYAVQKYGRRIPFSWETIIDDDLGAFKDIVERMGRAARRTEERFATDLFVNSTGPDPTLYSVGNANIITGNPALSVAGLQAGMTTFGNQKDADGEPIFVDGIHLVVPPALEITALNILNALEIRALTSGGGDAAQNVVAANWMKARITLHVNYYLPIINTTTPNSAWYLFANPNTGRPALEVGFLQGHEQPEVFIKSPNAMRVGGGEDPMAGDFDTDSIEYKVRHVLGGTTIDPKATAASTG